MKRSCRVLAEPRHTPLYGDKRCTTPAELQALLIGIFRGQPHREAPEWLGLRKRSWRDREQRRGEPKETSLQLGRGIWGSPAPDAPSGASFSKGSTPSRDERTENRAGKQEL